VAGKRSNHSHVLITNGTPHCSAEGSLVSRYLEGSEHSNPGMSGGTLNRPADGNIISVFLTHDRSSGDRRWRIQLLRGHL
ncbi:hypothetical protein PMAYCL1PPCAC_27155, partial [Pristionchus mayeri]